MLLKPAAFVYHLGIAHFNYLNQRSIYYLMLIDINVYTILPKYEF